MEWLVIGIVVVVGVVLLAYILRSKEGGFPPAVQARGDMAALNMTLPATPEETEPSDSAEAEESHHAD